MLLAQERQPGSLVRPFFSAAFFNAPIHTYHHRHHPDILLHPKVRSQTFPLPQHTGPACRHTLTRFSCCQRKGQGRAFLLPLSASAPPASTHPAVGLGWGLHCEANPRAASWDQLSSDTARGQLSTKPFQLCRKRTFFPVLSVRQLSCTYVGKQRRLLHLSGNT